MNMRTQLAIAVVLAGFLALIVGMSPRPASTAGVPHTAGGIDVSSLARDATNLPVEHFPIH